MLTIGEFSKICSVTTKALRHYDEIDLLKPSEINCETGYRLYSITQLKTMLLINRLKGYSFSLEEIKSILERYPAGTLTLRDLEQKRHDIVEKRDALDEMVKQMDDDIQNMKRGVDIMSYMEQIPVELVEMKPMNILSLRKVISTDEYGAQIGKLYERIHQDNLTPLGGPLFLYHHEEFNPDATDIEVAIPVKEAVKGTRDLPGGLCAKTIHRGPYSELTAAYSRLREWIEQEGYVITDAPYDVYVSNPAEVAPKDLITDVYFPVKKK